MTHAIAAVQLIRQPASAVVPVARIQGTPQSHSQDPASPTPASSVAVGIAELDRFLAHMIKLDASDLYVTAESPPVFRVNGEGLKARAPLSAEQVDALVHAFLTPEQRDEFARGLELNIALERSDGRFRINVFRQRKATGFVVRLIRTKIRTMSDLGYPAIMQQIVMARRGLVLVVGGTGSGKSTALAAMIDHRNTEESGHIVTIEDPIEFIHHHKKSVVTQREIGVDTHSYKNALKNTLRQAPDVILIGEIRDTETMEAALMFAETGHLCISTLHANNANQAVERVLNLFPAERHAEIRLQLSMNLRAVISQRLAPTLQRGRASVLEIMIDTPRIKELIKRGETDALKDAMVQGSGEGCCTFDESVVKLFAAGQISEAEALKASDSPNNVRMKIARIVSKKADPLAGEAPLQFAMDPSR